MKYTYLTAILTAALLDYPQIAVADPCRALMCMSAFSGNGTPSPTCALYKNEYLAHVVYRHEFFGMPLFDPVATFWLRHNFLMRCEGAVMNLPWVERIDSSWGMVPYWSP